VKALFRMSRRSHVVRTDDQGGTGVPRTLGEGCEILCSTTDAGSIGSSGITTIASITVAASSDYRRCLVAATVGQMSVQPPQPPQPAYEYDWYMEIVSGDGLSSGESPHYTVTPDPSTGGNVPLTEVAWGGKASVAGVVGEGGTAEFWIDNNLVYTLQSTSSGEVNDQFPIDLRGLNIVLVPGQQLYFKAITGVWAKSGWIVGGVVSLRGSASRGNVHLDWPL
jgi:hypothetical protein